MKLLLPIFSLFLLSCAKDIKRNANIEVKYNNNIVYSKHVDYNTELDLQNALDDSKKPDLIIVSAEWCRACSALRSKIDQLGIRNRVIILNIEERWVSFIASSMGIRAVPALILTRDSGRDPGQVFYGPWMIENILKKEIR